MGTDTITKRLFFSFSILVLSIVLISLLSLIFLWHTRTIDRISQQISNQRILIIQLIKTDLDFLRFETVKHEFYETGQSSLLKERDSLSLEIKNQNTVLYSEMVRNEFLIDYQFHQIDSALKAYNSIFMTLTKRINERGFKDYGLEGEMRDYAHQLENMDSSISLTEILMLRRHEKDFLLRKEVKYNDQFNALADDLTHSLDKMGYSSSVGILKSYQNSFNRLVKLNYEIGIVPTEGLLGQLNTQTKLISKRLQYLTTLSRSRSEKVILKSAIFFSVIAIVTVILSILLTYYTSTRLARPIKKLSDTISKFMVNEGLDEKELEKSLMTNEISNLSQSFIKLSRKLRRQFSEIQQQNNELKKLNAELDRFIYSAAHDLKSPLVSLDGLIRLADREINSPENAHYFQMMASTIHKLYGFIGDITDYAKNKRQKLNIEKIDLNKMIQEIVDSLKFLPHADRVQVLIHLKGSDFFTDRTRLEIILKNLISNSFRYLDPTKSDLLIRIESVINERETSIKITDNGIGIEKQHKPKIFDMFYRAVEHSQGTGIGLFLVKESVKMLRGRISVESSLGEWTFFYLSIPNFRHGNENIPESEAIVYEKIS